MCGIWGIFSKTSSGLFSKDADNAIRMMVVSSLRGMHSTGMAITHYKKPWQKPRTYRVVGGPNFLFQSKDWKGIAEYLGSDGGAVFGHARFATKGDVTVRNAHPFNHKHITLVHNGTISSGLSYKSDEKEVEVDSHALCIAIAEEGFEKTLNNISGAFAIIVHDQQEKCIWVAKNNERPLHFAETSDRMFVMSEKEDLEFVMKKASVYVVPQVKPVGDNVLWKYDLQEHKWEEAAKLTPKPKVYSYSQYGYAGYVNQDKEPTQFDRKIYKQDKKEIEFIVDSIEKVSPTEYLYKATSIANTDVQFRTATNIPDLIGATGKAIPSYTVFKDGKEYDFVRFRSIEWTSDADGTDYVATLSGKILKKEEWRVICHTERCGVCNEWIFDKDAANTLIKGDSVICKDCVEAHVLASAGS